ncbi:MAG: hypothetical protein WC175_05625 [Candidatus Dojkabacteria bacterium]
MEQITKLSSGNSVMKEILASVIRCGTRDVECIVDMCVEHPDTLEHTEEYVDSGGSMDFGGFVYGCHMAAYNEVSDWLDDFSDVLIEDHSDAEDAVVSEMQNLRDALYDLIIDDNYCAWGGLAEYGSYSGAYEDAVKDIQVLFTEFVVDSNRFEAFKVAVNDLFDQVIEDA